MGCVFTRRRRALAAVVVAGVFSCLAACHAQQPSTRRSQLSNGLTVLHRQNPAAQTVAMACFVKVPAEIETASSAGIRNLTQQMLLHRPSARGARGPLQKLSDLGAEVQVKVHSDCTQLTVACLAEEFSAAVPLVRQLLVSSRFDWSALKSVRADARRQLTAALEFPGGVAEAVGYASLFENRPCSWPETGTPQGLEMITRAQIARLHETCWRPNNIIVAVSGPMSFEECLRQIKAAFGPLVPGQALRVEPDPLPTGGGGRYIYRRWSSSNAAVAVFSRAPAPTGPEHAAMSALAAILGGGEGSRLWKLLREKRGIVYGVSSNISLARRCAVLRIVTECDAGDADDIAGLMAQSMNTAVSGPPERQELARVKRYLLGNHAISLQSNRHAAVLMGLYEIMDAGSGPQAQAFMENALADLTPEDVHNVAAKYLSNCLVVQVGGSRRQAR